MEYQSTTRYILISVCALFLGACGGGSGGSGVAEPLVGGASGGGGVQGAIKITITNPASGDNMETPDASVILEGTTDSARPIVSVNWVNNRGGQGEASGTDDWATGGIDLKPGENKITITAKDSSGGTGNRTIVIKRESAGTGSVTLSWSAPTHREDGSPLDNLAGYYIHYGKMSETYDYDIKIDNPGLTTYVVEGLTPGTWYFVISAFDKDDVESNFSNEVERTVE